MSWWFYCLFRYSRSIFAAAFLAFIGFILTLTVLKEPEKRILAAVEAKKVHLWIF